MNEAQRENDIKRIVKRLSGKKHATMTQIAQPMQPRTFEYCHELLSELITQGRVIEFDKSRELKGRPCKLYRLA